MRTAKDAADVDDDGMIKRAVRAVRVLAQWRLRGTALFTLVLVAWMVYLRVVYLT